MNDFYVSPNFDELSFDFYNDELNDKRTQELSDLTTDEVETNHLPHGWFRDGDRFYQPIEGHQMADEWELKWQHEDNFAIKCRFECVQSFDE